MGFGASAWQAAPRDDYIGWSHEQRQQHLHRVIINARFLIPPWGQSKNLASTIVGMAARRLAADWEARYHYRPVLLETFVEQDRFAGTAYKAANWVQVGEAKGRGKLGLAGKQSVPATICGTSVRNKIEADVIGIIFMNSTFIYD